VRDDRTHHIQSGTPSTSPDNKPLGTPVRRLLRAARHDTLSLLRPAADAAGGPTLGTRTSLMGSRRSKNARLSRVAGPDRRRRRRQVLDRRHPHRKAPRVDPIKIDVEGTEEDVWQGMHRTIVRNPGLAVILVLNVDRYEDPRSFLEPIGLAGFSFTTSISTLWSRTSPSTSYCVGRWARTGCSTSPAAS
jgi:hypothetical protein